MNTTPNRRLIVCLEPDLVGTALAAWLSRRAIGVVSDPSGAAALVAGPEDVVVSSQRYLSMATAIVLEASGTEVSVYREGRRESHRYRGLEWLSAFIEEQRGPPDSALAPRQRIDRSTTKCWTGQEEREGSK